MAGEAPSLARSSSDAPVACAERDPFLLYTFAVYGSVGVACLQVSVIRDHHAELLAKRLLASATVVDGRIVIDLSSVRSYTCAWLNTLVGLRSDCAALGGRLVVVGIDREGRRLLRETGLSRRLEQAQDWRQGVELVVTEPRQSWRRLIAGALGLGGSPAPRNSTAAMHSGRAA